MNRNFMGILFFGAIILLFGLGSLYAQNQPPVVSDIPDQTKMQAAVFDSIFLDNFVTDPDNPDSTIDWTYSGNTELIVSISSKRVAKIIKPAPAEEWYGSETITFRATDDSLAYDEDAATFTIVKDTAWVEVRYSKEFFVYDQDPNLTVEFWIKANAGIQASQIGFKMSRPIFNIDTAYWDPGIYVLISFLDYGADTVVLGGTSTISPPVVPMFPASTNYVLFATAEMTGIADSFALITEKAPWILDSAFFHPAGDFILSSVQGFAVSPMVSFAPVDSIRVVLGVNDIRPGIIPDVFELGQNYPNPFNPATKIEFAIPTRSFVSLTVYNILGEQVRTLVNEELDVGWKSVTWDGRDELGNAVASGVYLYKIIAGDFVESRKMMLVK